MFKAIFIKSSLVFLGIFCFSLLSPAQPAPTSATGKSADVTNAAPAKPVIPAQAAPVAQPVPKSADVTAPNPAPSQPVVHQANPGVPPQQHISGDSTRVAQPVLPVAPWPSQNLMPGQNEEKIKNSLVSRMNAFDLRKLKSIKWPPLDLIKHKDAEYADLDTIKDQKLLKKRLHDRCVDFVQAYENYVKEIYVTSNVGTQFSIQCDIYASILEDSTITSGDPFFDIPNEGLIRKLDQVTYTLYTAQSNGSLKRTAVIEGFLKSYDSSIFGLVGIPLQFSFLASQILMIVLLVISGFLLYKKIRG